MKLILNIFLILYGLKNAISGDNIPESINNLCGRILSTTEIPHNISDLVFKLKIPCETDESFALTKLEKITTSKHFDKDKKLVIFISGFLIGLPGTGVEAITNAYHCRGDSNVVATDTSNFLKTILVWSVFNTQEIGKIIAEGLARLVKEYNYPVDKIHIVSHSLGVHIAGNAGRYFKEITGKTIPRITGLDPANGCFNAGGNTGIQVGNAEFIDIIHTNPGVFGSKDVFGNVDFFVGGLNSKQPGCTIIGCSHIRACDYYAETVYPKNENNFLGVPCPSKDEINSKSCRGEAIPMGYKVPHKSNGIYYLNVNANSPYGKNVPEDTDFRIGCNLC